jgi:hypothetical protein
LREVAWAGTKQAAAIILAAGAIGARIFFIRPTYHKVQESSSRQRPEETGVFVAQWVEIL